MTWGNIYMLFMLFHVIFLVFFLQDLSKRIPVTARAPLLIGRPAAGECLPCLNHSFFFFIHIHACRNHFHYCFVIYEIIYEVSPNGVKYCKMCNQLSWERTTERTNLQMCRFLNDFELCQHTTIAPKSIWAQLKLNIIALENIDPNGNELATKICQVFSQD